MRFPVWLALSVLISISTGCAAIFQGADAEIAVTSNVGGANIIVDGKSVATTAPKGGVVKVKVPRRTTGMVIEKRGYEPVSVQLNSGLDVLWLFADSLFGIPPIGWILDAATGSWNGVSPNHFHAELERRRKEDEFEPEPR